MTFPDDGMVSRMRKCSAFDRAVFIVIGFVPLAIYGLAELCAAALEASEKEKP